MHKAVLITAKTSTEDVISILQYSQLQECNRRSAISRGHCGLTCHQKKAQEDHVQTQGGWNNQTKQQGQVPQMEEEVVGLLPLLARGSIGHSWNSWSG